MMSAPHTGAVAGEPTKDPKDTKDTKDVKEGEEIAFDELSHRGMGRAMANSRSGSSTSSGNPRAIRVLRFTPARAGYPVPDYFAVARCLTLSAPPICASMRARTLGGMCLRLSSIPR